MKRSERLTIASETVAILERGGYRNAHGAEIDLRERLEACRRDTKLFLPEELSDLLGTVQLKPGRFAKTEFEVRNETSLQGASRMVGDKIARVMVLNFASAKNPGGGFLNGSQAQEESLARSSGLYASLNMCREFYEFHRGSPSLLYTDRMIYSPGCPVFRDDDGRLLDAPYCVGFITSPAPNAGAIAHNQPAEKTKIPAVLKTRAEKVLAVAASYDCAALVLGAWGCGVFKNSPQLVASTFKELLGKGGVYHGYFHRVLFSVYDVSENLQTYREFEKAFG